MVIKDHNFEPTFFKVFESQANIIIKRLWNGGLPGYDKAVDVFEGKQKLLKYFNK